MDKQKNNKLCQHKLMASRDALTIIQGKWRIPILISLTYGKKRFSDIQKDIEDISPKMLSQELKSLEINKIITRKLVDSMPISVEYELTPLGISLKKLLNELLQWGLHLRDETVGKKSKKK